MTGKLFLSLYIGLIASMFILLISNITAGWIYFAFTFVAIFGGIFLIDRPAVIAAGFLLVSLVVMVLGYFVVALPERKWIALLISGAMSALSAFTLLWVIFKYKPAPPELASTPARTTKPRLSTISRTSPQQVRPRPAVIQENLLQALVCPGCGSSELEGEYPEYKCTYCGTRFVAAHLPEAQHKSGK